MLSVLWLALVVPLGLGTRTENQTWCDERPHYNWHHRHNRYYTILQDSPCRYPDCQAACRSNNGTLVIPDSKETFYTLLSLVNEFTGSAYLGIHLPLYTLPNDKAICSGPQCSDVLVYANMSSMTYQPWMLNHFDRGAHQPACFKMEHDKKLKRPHVVPAHCDEPLLAICEATCPRPGPPILPLTISQQETVPLGTQLLQMETSTRHKRDTFSKVSPVAEESYNPVPTMNEDLLEKLPAFPTDPNYGAPTSATTTDLIGYDCSNPREMSTVQMSDHTNPCGPPPEPVSQKNTSYVLLQKVNKVPITVTSCKITRTVIPYYCGVWSHSVLSPDFFRFQESVTLTPDKCQELWDNPTFTDRQGRRHPLHLNSTTKIYYNEVGDTKHTTAGPTCVGEDYHFNGKTYLHMVVSITQTFEMFQHSATLDDDQMIQIPQLGITLPCKFHNLGCKTSQHGTFFWAYRNPDETCSYYATRKTKGITVQDSQGRNLYISTDNTMIRLLIREPISRCGAIIYRTNYKKLFVTAIHDAQAFPDNLPPHELSVWTYSDMQDNFMMGKLTKFIQREFATIQQHACQTSVLQDRFDYDKILAEQHGSTDGDTASLGGGYFLTVAGEAYYRYRCRRLLVTARNTSSCYSSIPVTLQPNDLQAYLRARQLNASSTYLEFFLEPHSRHLTTRGIRIPCSSTFAPLYAAAKDTWLRIGPAIERTKTPEPLSLKTFSELPSNEATELDFEDGGIYTPEQIQQHDSHLDLARAAKEVQYNMGLHAQSTGWSSTSQSPFSFTNLAVDHPFVSFSLWGIIKQGLANWTYICTTTGSLYILLYLVYYFFACASAFFFPQIDPASTVQRFALAVQRPAFSHRRGNRRQRRQQQQQQSSPPPPRVTYQRQFGVDESEPSPPSPLLTVNTDTVSMDPSGESSFNPPITSTPQGTPGSLARNRYYVRPKPSPPLPRRIESPGPFRIFSRQNTIRRRTTSTPPPQQSSPVASRRSTSSDDFLPPVHNPSTVPPVPHEMNVTYAQVTKANGIDDELSRIDPQPTPEQKRRTFNIIHSLLNQVNHLIATRPGLAVTCQDLRDQLHRIRRQAAAKGLHLHDLQAIAHQLQEYQNRITGLMPTKPPVPLPAPRTSSLISTTTQSTIV